MKPAPSVAEAPPAQPSPPSPASDPGPEETGAAIGRAERKRMLVIVNPYATTVSDRLKNLVVYALQGRYEVEAVTTESKNHATEICREARTGEFDVVVAFGGDGTLNEVANGLAGTGIPLSILPGGSANVVCRTLGIPNDVVDATEHLLALADDFRPRPIDLGLANGRRFLFACGAGLDAATTRVVDANPKLKARAGRWFYASVAVARFYRDYLRDPVRLRMTVGDGPQAERFEGITAIAQNSDPYTYFGDRPVRVCEGASIDNGTLSVAVLRRAAQRDVPTLATRFLARGLKATDHRQLDHREHVAAAVVESVSRDDGGEPRSFPVEVDGDYIGDHPRLELGIEPGALRIVA